MFCFDKSKRLLNKQDFNQVFSDAKVFKTPEFTVLYQVNRSEHARLGLIVPKKVLAKAHDRNKIKRLIRESFRLQKQLPCIDVIILAKPKVKGMKGGDVFKQLEHIWDSVTKRTAHSARSTS